MTRASSWPWAAAVLLDAVWLLWQPWSLPGLLLPLFLLFCLARTLRGGSGRPRVSRAWLVLFALVLVTRATGPSVLAFPALGWVLVVALCSLATWDDERGVGRFLALDNFRPWPRVLGRTPTWVWVWVVGGSCITCATMLLWLRWAGDLGFGRELLESFAWVPLPLLLFVGIPLAAVANAYAEESICRGVWLDGFESGAWPPLAINLVQAAWFAAAHYAAGCPSGTVGFGLVFVWALFLFELRRRSNSLVPSLIVHIVADLTIFYGAIAFVD